MRFRNQLVMAGAGLVLSMSACQTYDTGHDAPSRIVDASDASRAELQQAVDRATGVHVLLAENALTDSSVLTLERNQPATMQNPLPQGRITEMPIQFRLVKRGQDCFLIDQRDQTRYLLETTRCVPE